MNTAERYDQGVQPLVFRISADVHLDYRSIPTFKNLCNDKLAVPAHVIVDLAKTRYIDSSGVALLHCLRHWINAPSVTLQVINCPPELRHCLSVGQLGHYIQVD